MKLLRLKIVRNRILDQRGNLLSMDLSDVPFLVKRVFFVSDVRQDVRRGGHAHIACEQFLIVLNGQINVQSVRRSGVHRSLVRESITLHDGDSFYSPPLCWLDLCFSRGSVLAVLASHSYSADDYIRDFEAFRTGEF